MRALFILIILAFSLKSFAGVEKSNLQELNKKEVKAMVLINKVGELNSQRFSNEEDKYTTEQNYRDFIVNYQSIKEELSSFESKELVPDEKTVNDCSKKLDKLIKNLQIFLNS